MPVSWSANPVMGVLTLKEWEKHKSPPPIKGGAVEKSAAPPEKEEQLFEYVFFYPDNITDRYHTGVYRVNVDGVIKEHPIVNGVVKVRSIKERDALIKEGFLFIKVQEVIEE